MDLDSILNTDDRSRVSNQAYTRTIHNGHREGNVSSRTAGRSMTNSTKASPVYSPPLAAYSSKNSSNLDRSSWQLGRSSPKMVSGNIPGNGRASTNRRPRINTSTISLSESANRRGSVNSTGSRSSSSRSPPSPPTPSSMASISRPLSSLSYGRELQYKQQSNSGTKTLEPQKRFSGVNNANQTQINPSMISSIPHTTRIVNQSQIHLNRILPPPIATGSPGPLSTHLPSPMRPPITIPPSPLSPTKRSHQHSQPSSQSQRLCSAIVGCDYSTPKRRIVSQFFGRNKKETRLIPRHCWIYYCRQHYQRLRYRLTTLRFAEMQMQLVHATITKLESERIVTSWEVKLRKRVLERINKSTNNWTSKSTSKLSSSSSKSSSSSSSSSPTSSRHSTASSGGEVEARERLLMPYCGAGKSFKQVYEVLNLVNEICARDNGPALEFEILPSFTAEWVREEENRRRISRTDGTASNSESDDEE